MKSNIVSKTFLIDYVRNLFERTNHIKDKKTNKKTVKYGFDWLIYQLGLSKDWYPVRLPFIRTSDGDVPKIKTEAEFGIDISFLIPSKTELIIFILKDEVLNNSNWTSHNFDSDLRMAIAPDLNQKGFESIESVKVILAYNKDEDKNGIQLFENFINNAPAKVGNEVQLSFERWNLTKIVEEVETHLLTAEMIPQNLYGIFQYICSQVKDFEYGSDEWEKQLIPNWKNFLNIVFQAPLDIRKLNLIPVSLLIINNYRKETPNSFAGFIDMIEWAMLSIWSSINSEFDNEKEVKNTIINIWLNFYILILESYLIESSNAFTTQHGFSCHRFHDSSKISAINDSYLSYWHIGRLGIFTIAVQEFSIENEEKDKKIKLEIINRSADWMIKCLELNPSSLRPIIDLNHIELFLIWYLLWGAGKYNELKLFFSELESRLLIRRAQKGNTIPFIESSNRMDLVVKYLLDNEEPSDYVDSSSYLLLMILELCFSLNKEDSEELIIRYFKRIINGIGDDDSKIADYQIDLLSWIPPDDWNSRILNGKVNDGIAVSTNNFSINKNYNKLPGKIIEFVNESRKKYPMELAHDIPLAVRILACIKHKSPLPAEFWRKSIFDNVKKENKK